MVQACRVQESFHAPSVALEWAATASSAMAAKEMQWAQALGKTKKPDYRCTRCQGIVRHLDSRPLREAQVGPNKLEVVASFCYLHVGDMLSAAGVCELSTTIRVKTTWSKFTAATTSLLPPPLFQDTWSCILFLGVEPNAPCQ